ncbi:MAG: 16S rRNA (cytosine(1402)-N(4))-methyltransferase RsmH, partial [Hyphomicrobiaceae bacterium]
MTARSGTPTAEGDRRGTRRHVPVLLPEVLAALAPQVGERFIDGTFGAGGYTAALIDAAPDVRVLAIDRDRTAIAAGRPLAEASGGRLTLVEGRFGELDSLAEAAGFAPADGVVLDIGVSSMQLDDPERGFSFQSDGPLDMRMSGAKSGDGPTAADVVNAADDADIADILFHLGQERRSRAIARAIVARRRVRPFSRTAELAEVVERVLGRGKVGGRHPATRTFQALRIYVNDELGELTQGLAAAERVLQPGGRLAVVTFHSLEDAIVKRFLKLRSGRQEHGSRHLPPGAPPERQPSFRFINPRPINPSETETATNPRSRSARLRWAARTDAPAWPAEA